jgi:superfamily I DNA/RNA helicase
VRVLIDEDIPKELTAQFRMPGVIVDHLELSIGESHDLAVAGDRDQTIYTFTGATRE